MVNEQSKPLREWQQEVEVTKVPKMLQERYTIELESGDKRQVAKYRLSHFEYKTALVNGKEVQSSAAIVNDLSNAAYKKYAKNRAEEKVQKRRDKIQPKLDKIKELREERNELKAKLRASEKGVKTKEKRLESKKAKVAKLQEEIKILEEGVKPISAKP